MEDAVFAPPIDFRREHFVRRFGQIRHIQRQIELKEQAVRDAKSHVKELEKELDGLHQEHRAASRDEGDLPLLDMMDDAKGQAN